VSECLLQIPSELEVYEDEKERHKERIVKVFREEREERWTNQEKKNNGKKSFSWFQMFNFKIMQI